MFSGGTPGCSVGAWPRAPKLCRRSTCIFDRPRVSTSPTPTSSEQRASERTHAHRWSWNGSTRCPRCRRRVRSEFFLPIQKTDGRADGWTNGRAKWPGNSSDRSLGSAESKGGRAYQENQNDARNGIEKNRKKKTKKTPCYTITGRSTKGKKKCMCMCVCVWGGDVS